MELAEIERWLGLPFPEKHRQAMLNAFDPIHDACVFLVPSSRYALLRLLEINQFLHDKDEPDPWPSFLVAFASNGCGDYFAYDLRGQPPRILYIEPDWTIEENLHAKDKLEFESFEAWYQDRLTKDD